MGNQSSKNTICDRINNYWKLSMGPKIILECKSDGAFFIWCHFRNCAKASNKEYFYKLCGFFENISI